MNETKETPRTAIDDVADLLTKAGHPAPYAWAEGINPIIHQAEPGYQRFLVNNKLRLFIGAFEEDTTNIRYMIDDNCSHEDWLRMLENSVVKFMVENAGS